LNILLVTDSYPPEIRSASHLMLELAQELHRRGHAVSVITTWPEYNLDQSEEKKTFDELTVEDGITVIRVKTLPHHNVNYVVRGLSQLLMPLQFLLKLRTYRVKPHAVIVYSPPLPLALVGSWLRRKRVKNILNVQDLFPQNAIDLGILRSPLQIKFFQWLERLAYRTADVVTVHSEGNRHMVAQGYPWLTPRLKLLHNWVDIGHHDASDAATDFRSLWRIKQKYIAVFAGVLGPSQYLTLILELADRMRDFEELLFLFVGDGSEKSNLQALAESMGLKNVRFEGFISRDAYPQLLKTCDIGLVCLSPQNKTPVVPGKILGHMASGLPVAAFLQQQSDGHQIIKEAGCGVSAFSNDLDSCERAFRMLLSHAGQLKATGNAGKRYATLHFSKDICVTQLEKLLDENA
jgi:glycosyltransferase involved in cell wall biosynthesis